MSKILIAGLGGVGGYFGGLLAQKYYQDKDIAINFLARGANLEAVQRKGLEIIKGEGRLRVYPAAISDNAENLGPQDYIIICTKNYDLESIVQQLAPCIKKDTVIIPLQNGVDSRERIEKLVNGNIVCDGCVYIVSRLLSPGVIENTGNAEMLYFGAAGVCNERLTHLEQLLKDAGIQASLPTDISVTVWEKFIFLAPIATATSYYDSPVGVILADEKTKEIVTQLVEEAVCLARMKNIQLSEDIADHTMSKIASLPFDATTSMHLDFKAAKPRNELESLTGYVVREARTGGLAVPLFEKLYRRLTVRMLV